MNDEMFDELVASIKEAGAIRRDEQRASRVFRVDAPDVRKIRESLNLSQTDFAALLGISVRTVQNWEQGRREPEGPARMLLQVAAAHPQAVLDTVKQLKMETEAV